MLGEKFVVVVHLIILKMKMQKLTQIKPIKTQGCNVIKAVTLFLLETIYANPLVPLP